MGLTLVGDGRVGQVGEIAVGDSAELGANDVRGETGAEKAAIKRRDFALIERAAKVCQAAFYAGANQSGFVRFRKDSLHRSFDVTVGNAAGTELARNAKASLAAQFRVLIGVIERVSSVVQVFQFAQTRDDRRNEFLVLGAAFEVLLHFVNRICPAHQGAKRRIVKFLFGGNFAK